MDQERPDDKKGEYEYGGFTAIRDQPPPYSPLISKRESAEYLISKPEVHTPIPKPMDWLILSIFTVISCCFPLGLAAVIYSIKSRSAAEYQDFRNAKRYGRIARNLSLAGIIIGSIIIAIIVYLEVSVSMWVVNQLKVANLTDHNINYDSRQTYPHSNHNPIFDD